MLKSDLTVARAGEDGQVRPRPYWAQTGRQPRRRSGSLAGAELTYCSLACRQPRSQRSCAQSGASAPAHSSSAESRCFPGSSMPLSRAMRRRQRGRKRGKKGKKIRPRHLHQGKRSRASAQPREQRRPPVPVRPCCRPRETRPSSGGKICCICENERGRRQRVSDRKETKGRQPGGVEGHQLLCVYRTGWPLCTLREQSRRFQGCRTRELWQAAQGRLRGRKGRER